MRAELRVSKVVQFGRAPESPKVSVIVPLYGRVDFVEHQMSQWASDAEVAKSDLIYVLDSPEHAEMLIEYCEQLFQLYKVPFRLLCLAGNMGFGMACNAGAAEARGNLILFLNSDVLPDGVGWLYKMAQIYESTPGVGALGPKLVYEDGSLQHAGIFFRKTANGIWMNEHFFKGLHQGFPDANGARTVPAVTGACLMVATELFRSIDGFSSEYVQGDFEDTDFCLRLVKAGYINWYTPAVSLYHLEGQSYPSGLRRPASSYNAWLQTHMWDEFIGEVMAAYAGSDAAN